MPTGQVRSPLGVCPAPSQLPPPDLPHPPPDLPHRVAALLMGVKWDFLPFLYGFATGECSPGQHPEQHPQQHGYGLAFCG